MFYEDLKTKNFDVLGASEITANLYYNCVHLYWEGLQYIFAVIYDTRSSYPCFNFHFLYHYTVHGSVLYISTASFSNI